VQLVPKAIDSYALDLTFYGRSVFLDLLCRVNYETHRYPLTITDYAGFLGIGRKRLSAALNELVDHGLITSTAGSGHEGFVTVDNVVYCQCVRVGSASRSRRPRADLATNDANEQAKRPSDIRRNDNQTSDPFERDRERLRSVANKWSELTGKSIEDDDIARCLTYCQTDCLDRNADPSVIDETIGRVEEAMGHKPPNDLLGYFRKAVQKNIAERLGLSA
jgi:hypothetical protein